MVVLLSQSYQYYKKPKDIQVGDKIYKDIICQDSRDFIDNDGKRKIANYLEKEDSELIAYVENNKVVKSYEYYNTPKTMKLGNKTYNNIAGKLSIPNSYDIYSTISSDGFYNKIKVRENGSIIDIGELKRNLLVRKIKQPFIKLAKLFH